MGPAESANDQDEDEDLLVSFEGPCLSRGPGSWSMHGLLNVFGSPNKKNREKRCKGRGGGVVVSVPSWRIDKHPTSLLVLETTSEAPGAKFGKRRYIITVVTVLMADASCSMGSMGSMDSRA